MTEADYGPREITFIVEGEDRRDLEYLMRLFEIEDPQELYNGLALGFLSWAVDKILSGRDIAAYDSVSQTATILSLAEFERLKTRDISDIEDT